MKLSPMQVHKKIMLCRAMQAHEKFIFENVVCEAGAMKLPTSASKQKTYMSVRE